jgi:hypothetical protein
VLNESADAALPFTDTKVSTGTARLGDLVTLNIDILHPLFIQVDSPTWPQNLSTFEVSAATALPVQVNAANVVTRFQAQLQNFTTGPQLLPALDITYHDPMGRLHTLKTSTLTVTIQAVPPDPKANGDIRGIRDVAGPVAWSPWWWLLAAIVAAGIGAWFWRARKRSVLGPPPPPPEPADLKALRKLEALLATGWVQEGKIKEFYSGVSDIVRGYLEDAFKTPALERTTAEIMRQLRKKTDLSSTAQTELKNLLEGCDLVKFAKFRPDPAEAIAEHAVAVRFVEGTCSQGRSIQAAAPIPQ